MAITAAVIRDRSTMCAAGALIEMPAERSRTTPRNGQQYFDMLPTDPLAVSLDEGSSSSADEIGNLERRRARTSAGAVGCGAAGSAPTMISETRFGVCLRLREDDGQL